MYFYFGSLHLHAAVSYCLASFHFKLKDWFTISYRSGSKQVKFALLLTVQGDRNVGIGKQDATISRPRSLPHWRMSRVMESENATKLSCHFKDGFFLLECLLGCYESLIFFRVSTKLVQTTCLLSSCFFLQEKESLELPSLPFWQNTVF